MAAISNQDRINELEAKVRSFEPNLQNIEDYQKLVTEALSIERALPKDSKLRQSVSRIQSDLKSISEIVDLIRATSNILIGKKNLIVSQANQYQIGGANASLCTSCAVAFVQHMKSNLHLDEDALTRILESGKNLHTNTTKALKAAPNTNFNAQQVLANNRMMEIRPAVTGRPISDKNLSNHYKDSLISAFLDLKRRKDRITSAVLTKAPYSAAIVYKNEQFYFFDSHGEQATHNRAFVRIFENEKQFSDYLAERYGFCDFPDVDFDIETGQDNPNSWELTFF